MTAAMLRAADIIEAGDPAEHARRDSLREHDGPLGLATALSPHMVETPAARVVSDALEHAITHPGTRLLITMSPQESKSSSARRAILRALQRHPDRRNAIVSYAVDLAGDHGQAVRDDIEAHGSRVIDPATGEHLPDRLGIAIRRGKGAAGNWMLQGHQGGLRSIGLGGGLTGRSVNGVLLIDDPVKDREQADSLRYRDRAWNWLQNVGETRLAPTSSVVLIMTRWHPDDLAGRLLAQDALLPEGEREWWWLNIPALATPGVPDALEGIPGARWPDGHLVSVLGRTPEQWRAIRRRVGERAWGALYLGTPTPPEGGIFRRAWFEAHRLRQLDALPVMVDVLIGVDPADTGTGDAAGIVVAGRDARGVVWLLADLTDWLAQDRWGRVACLAWLMWSGRETTSGSARILQERNLGMRSTIPDAWARIVRQARALTAAAREVGRPACADPVVIAVAEADLAARGEFPTPDTEEETAAQALHRELTELAPYAAEAVQRPSTGPPVDSQSVRTSKTVRAESTTALFQTGRARIAGELRYLEDECVTWQAGQASPNRIDVMAMIVTRLDTSREPTVVARRPAAPVQVPRGPSGRYSRPTF